MKSTRAIPRTSGPSDGAKSMDSLSAFLEIDELVANEATDSLSPRTLMGVGGYVFEDWPTKADSITGVNDWTGC